MTHFGNVGVVCSGKIDMISRKQLCLLVTICSSGEIFPLKPTGRSCQTSTLDASVWFRCVISRSPIALLGCNALLER